VLILLASRPPRETITTTRVSTYTYDSLNRLVDADYSTGEAFEYDAAGNRTVMTATTPLSGTVVTTYILRLVQDRLTTRRTASLIAR